MKIIHITSSLANGGLENMMVDIANRQNEKGNQVAIIIINNNIETSIFNRINKEIKLFLIKRKISSKSIIPGLRLFIVLTKLNKYNIIHCHGSGIGKMLRLLTRQKRILTIHGLNLEISPLKYYHGLFAISKAVKYNVERRSNLKPTVVYNGVDLSAIPSKNLRTSIQIQNIRIIQIGQLLTPVKGQDLLIQALRRLIFDFNLNNIIVDFIGQGPSLDELKSLANNLKVANHITFLGNTSREWIYKNLANYDIFVQPSRYEGFGLTVAEAMAAKVPVIVASNDGPAEIINNGEFGLVFKNGDYIDLSDKLLEVIHQIKNNEIQPVIEKAYQYCHRNFNINTTVSNYLTEYEKVLNRL